MVGKMAGKRRYKPKIPRFENRTIVLDESSDIQVVHSPFELFTNRILRKRPPKRNNVVKNDERDENRVVGRRRKKKNAKNTTENSFPTPLKEKIAEINEINDNYQLHITKGSASSKNATSNDDKSVEISTTNTRQIGTSTPSIFDRFDRKICVVEISRFDDIPPVSPLFENSQLCDEKNETNQERKNIQNDDASSSVKSFSRKKSIDEQQRVVEISQTDMFFPSEISPVRGDSSSIQVIENSRRTTTPKSVKNNKEEIEKLEEYDQLAELIDDLSFEKPKNQLLENKTFNVTARSLNNSSVQSTRSQCRMSFVGVCSPYFTKNRASLRYDARATVFEVCEQENGPVSWDFAIPKEMINQCRKIGEGTYGEVFQSMNLKGESVALKVIPIEGNFAVNDEPQKKFEEILPEILIATEISNLRHNELNNTPNFVEVKSVYCVQGCYPQELIDAWDDFKLTRASENDRPDMFNENQLFIVFEFANCGSDLENFNFTSVEQAKSVLVQLTLTLAIAEKVLQFEHRDLHIGNVLVKHTDEELIEYELDGCVVHVKSCGVQVFIIDFTNSRLHKESCTIFTDLAKDEAMFEGSGDYQFDIYRAMRELNNNDWKKFEPKSNILWLHYIIDKLCKVKKYYRGKCMSIKARYLFECFADDLLQHSSCEDFVTNNDNELFYQLFSLPP